MSYALFDNRFGIYAKRCVYSDILVSKTNFSWELQVLLQLVGVLLIKKRTDFIDFGIFATQLVGTLLN